MSLETTIEGLIGQAVPEREKDVFSRVCLHVKIFSRAEGIQREGVAGEGGPHADVSELFQNIREGRFS